MIRVQHRELIIQATVNKTQTVTRKALVLGLLLTLTFGAPMDMDPDLEMMALVPPSRPNGFQNFQEMQRYLMELNRFYNMMSRPRYGRSAPKPEIEIDAV